jgi:hypothetical protein
MCLVYLRASQVLKKDMIFFTVFFFLVKCSSCILHEHLNAPYALFNDILITLKKKNNKQINKKKKREEKKRKEEACGGILRASQVSSSYKDKT